MGKVLREADLFSFDYPLQEICGIDEAGRGPLAGPVCAAAVILPADFPCGMLDDSKAPEPIAKGTSIRDHNEKGSRLGRWLGDLGGNWAYKHSARKSPCHETSL